MPPDMNHPEFSRRKLRFENSMARVPDDTEKTERCMTMFQACLIERFLKDGWRMIQEHKELNERKGQVSEQAFRRLKFKALVSQTVYERSAKEAVAYGKKWRARVVGSHERNDSTCCEPFASEYIETLSHLTHKFKEKVAECNAEYEFKMNVLMPVRLDRRRLDRSANI